MVHVFDNHDGNSARAINHYQPILHFYSNNYNYYRKLMLVNTAIPALHCDYTINSYEELVPCRFGFLLRC
jgi:regulatory protein YycI of two-component signal transduction system YycFG